MSSGGPEVSLTRGLGGFRSVGRCVCAVEPVSSKERYLVYSGGRGSMGWWTDCIDGELENEEKFLSNLYENLFII